MKRLLLCAYIALCSPGCKSQEMVRAATKFIASLDASGKQKALYTLRHAGTLQLSFLSERRPQRHSAERPNTCAAAGGYGLIKKLPERKRTTESAPDYAPGSAFKRAGKAERRQTGTATPATIILPFLAGPVRKPFGAGGSKDTIFRLPFLPKKTSWFPARLRLWAPTRPLYLPVRKKENKS
jgi:hypothetical protein